MEIREAKAALGWVTPVRADAVMARVKPVTAKVNLRALAWVPSGSEMQIAAEV